MRQMDMLVDFDVWEEMLEYYLSQVHGRTDQHCRAEAGSLTIRNNLPREFVDKAIVSYRNRPIVCCCSCSGYSEHPV